MKLYLAGIIAAACWLGFANPLVGWAQAAGSATALPAFDVVSVKPTRPPCQDSGFYPVPDGLHIPCFFLGPLIQQAYGIYESSRIVGLPGWVQSASYDIDAKVDSANVAAYDRLEPGQRSLMLQALLEDRFRLKTHREMKDFPAYALEVAKGGSKLKKAKPIETAQPGAKADPLAGPIMWRKGRGQIVSRSRGLSFFLRLLSQEVGRPVVDRTGLTGVYDFTLQWTSDQGKGSVPTEGDVAISSDGGPSIFTALQEQLGLRLEPITTSLDVLVVDHIEKPSEN